MKIISGVQVLEYWRINVEKYFENNETMMTTNTDYKLGIFSNPHSNTFRDILLIPIIK